MFRLNSKQLSLYEWENESQEICYYIVVIGY